MPIHDWTRVDAGLFHAFHQRWISALSDALNTGGLPSDYFALAEQSIRRPIPDVLTLAAGSDEYVSPQIGSPAVDVAVVPPKAKLIQESDLSLYARKADRLTVRHRHGRVVAVIEIVSPGNKASRSEFRAFVEKTADLIQQGVHVVVVDMFSPGKRDPGGIHTAIWSEFGDEAGEDPIDKALTVVSYRAGAVCTAYVEPVAVGEELPDIPLFLEESLYIPLPLERSYQASWAMFPEALKGLLAG